MRRRRLRAHPGDERGFALVAVLLVMAILGVVGAEFAYSMRLEASSSRAFKQRVIAGYLAEAAVEQAIREIVAPTITNVCSGDDGWVSFWSREGKPLPRLRRENVPLGDGAFTYRLSDEEARININTAPPDRLDRLLAALGVDKTDRDTIVDSVQDWRDANEEHRLNGGESEDTYLKLPVPYRSHNANLESVAELVQVKGVTRKLYEGGDGTPGLKDVLTAKTPGSVNINSAGRAVLKALNLSDAEVNEIGQGRRDACYVQVPARFAGRGLAATSRTFRIEAEALIDGQVRGRLTAVVQKRPETGGVGIAVLEWSGLR